MGKEIQSFMIRRIGRDEKLTPEERLERLHRRCSRAEGLLYNHSAKAIAALLSEQTLVEVHKILVEELLDALKEIKAEQLRAESSDGKVLVTTAYPLVGSERDELWTFVKRAICPVSEVVVEENRDLIAGFRFRVGSLEIDGSLDEKCREYDCQLKRTLDED